MGSIGYYRLTGYLYPFRETEALGSPTEDRTTPHVLSTYRPGTSIAHIAQVIDFDRRLRMLVLDGVERIEVAVRMRVGYVLGRRSPFAHLQPATFLPTFIEPRPNDRTGWPTTSSKHIDWLRRVEHRLESSDEAFVAHFRSKYDSQMPIWALTEVLELGHLSRLYEGLNDEDASDIARAFAVPTKKMMRSWLASLNYVRNVAAHHSRLFNRKLQNAPARRKANAVELLGHLSSDCMPKGAFGTYNALAVIAYLLRSVDGAHLEWSTRMVGLLRDFPATPALPLTAVGVPQGWETLEIWQS